MRLVLAILVGKLIAFLTKLFKIGGGSAAPGLYALKIYPNLVEKLAAQIPQTVIITGTNGKTTTSKMLSSFAKNANLNVLRNPTGSNLERGVASALISHSNFLAEIKNIDLAIWELDEAAFNNIAIKLDPQIIVFLNIFRDQLDRYGEIDSVLKNWSKTLESLPKSTIIFTNGDDQNTLKLSKNFTGLSFKFGVKDYKIVGEAIKKQFEQENLDFEAKNIKQQGLNGLSFDLSINHQTSTIHLPVPGIYHIYDALAALAVGYQLNLNVSEMIKSLKTYQPAFGRFEKFSLTPQGWEAKSQNMEGYIFLIKNPAGATQVFQTIAKEIKSNDHLLLALNDNLADGTDVSWIWDSQFELLTNTTTFVCSGTRARDLAVRLKYAGVALDNIKIEADLKHAFKLAKKDLAGRLFILSTYTAMLELQKILANSGVKKNYWEGV
ncbi:DUF1727 domain-containing protein [Candidatus Daviesbacteria bacterium]|nr:DUF1727 domain-containing protein [Candidatus Daviesbacteria bacterium]